MSERKNAHVIISMVIGNFSKESLEKYKLNDFKESSTVKVTVGDVVTQWLLRLYPHGHRKANKSNISLFLMLKESNSPNFSVSYRFGILGQREKDNFIDSSIKRPGIDLVRSKGYGSGDFISHEEILDESKGLIVDGSVKFFCDLNISTEESPERDDDKQLSSLNQELASDFKKLFEGKLFIDFKLKTNDGNVLEANKAVLAARSPVFFKMLTIDMQEAKENEVNVPDFDSTTITELLRFIYCNEVENLDVVARDLIYAAEKYELEKLKEICVDSIISTLTTDNVLKTLSIAESVSNTKNMFNESLDLIFQNFDAFSTTDEWKELPKDCMMKVIQQVMSRYSEQDTIDASAEPL